jgi:hypothetical protein
LSGTFLYLAIVAIWVCILVPRWMRRSHPAPVVQDTVLQDTVLQDTVLQDDVVGEATGTGEFPADHYTGAWVDTTVTVASATLTETSRWLAGDEAEIGHEPPVPPVPEYAESLTVTTDSVTFTAESPDPEPARQPQAIPRPPLTRAHVLQARRRLLSTLLALATIAAAFTVIGLARWWVCIPPAIMLGFYLPLLRQAALADAENQHRRQEAVRAQLARERARALRAAEAAQAAPSAWAAAPVAPEPQAQIIDISARVADQLYDQYADAAVRAVGD